MPYSARITQANPTAFLILVDQSGSMAEQINTQSSTITDTRTKAQAVADAINELVAELVARTRRMDGYSNYYSIGILGYSSSEVRSLIEGTTLDQPLVTPSQLDSLARKREVTRLRNLTDGRSVTTTTTQKWWIEPYAEWNTPMGDALESATKIIRKWRSGLKSHNCYPPTVINITDGEATDRSPDELRKVAERLRDISTDDGNTLLINIHISATNGQPVVFPGSVDELPNERYAHLLYELSSPMPDLLTATYKKRAARGMAYNANMIELVQMLNIGTSSSKLLINASAEQYKEASLTEDDSFCEGMRPILQNGMYGYEDQTGHIVIEACYDSVGEFGEGRAVVILDGMAGLIDRDGRQVIAPEYDDVSWDGSRYAYVDIAGKRGVMQRNGTVVVPPEYDWVGEFSNGFAVVAQNGRYGYVDSCGKLLEPGLIYDNASSVDEHGDAQITKNGLHKTIKMQKEARL